MSQRSPEAVATHTRRISEQLSNKGQQISGNALPVQYRTSAQIV
ncbi:hypothetical protein [Sphingobacterium sp. E70]|nr:hypothetical protein [Sphingobacterium sp. E70]